MSSTIIIPAFLAAGSAALAPRYWVSFPRGRMWVNSAAQKTGLDELVDFLGTHTRGETEVLLTPYVPNLYYLMGFRGSTRYFQLRARQHSREQLSEALESLKAQGYPKIFHFTAYDSDRFLKANWPDQPTELYHQEWSWFVEQLQEHYKTRDFGAILIYERR